ncbi:MAG: hypothetical protein H7332_09000 [Bdellovibrionales bacterium]|nr:hypothetical protein [Ramlibacter sp.]
MPYPTTSNVPATITNAAVAPVRAASDALRRLKHYDEARDSFPGEHWVVLAAGIGIWYATQRHPNMVVKFAGAMVGTALVGRAASGRDGLIRVVRWLPFGGSVRRYR